MPRRQFLGTTLSGAALAAVGAVEHPPSPPHSSAPPDASGTPGTPHPPQAPGLQNPIVLQNAHLRVLLDPQFPRVFAYHVPHQPVLLGAIPEEPPVVELNDTPHAEFHVTAQATAAHATYVLTVPALPLRLTFRVALERNELVLQLTHVEEAGAFRLKTLYFPKHYLIRLPAEIPDATLYRGEYSRRPWSDTNYRAGYLFSTPQYLPLATSEPAETLTHVNWAALYTKKLCATVQNTVGVWKLHTQLLGYPGTCRDAALWNGVYYYRAAGQVQPLLESRVGILTEDANHDGQVDWMEAALWHRRFIPDANPLYTGPTIFYRVIHAWAPPNNEVLTTFEEVLPMIRSMAEITGGLPQLLLLTGWEGSGFETIWPAFDVVNPALGGSEKLKWLAEEAKQYNAILVPHLNVDDAYPGNPRYDERVLCTGWDGKPYPWAVYPAPGMSKQNYHISHTKEVESGYFQRRAQSFLDAIPATKAVHLDACRYSNVSYSPDRVIDIGEEWAAVRAMFHWFSSRGLDPSVESPHDGFYGVLSWTWTRMVLNSDPFHLLMMHGKLYGCGDVMQMKDSQTKSREADLLGYSILNGAAARPGKFDPPYASVYNADEMTQHYYLGQLLQWYMGRRELLWIGEQDGEYVVRLAGGCEGRTGKTPPVITDGDVLIREGDSVCIPLSATEVRLYSKEAQTRTWTLPAGWAGRTVQLVELGADPGPVKELRLAGTRLTVTMAAGRPYAVRTR